MQKWFNQLNLTSSIIICCLLVLGGVSLIFLRISKDIPFGLGIGVLLIIEAIILLYKKYFVDE
tara:strand:- start:63 stop:251 length:189 start_codon:yes stop_codon:yes gene_type:complete